MTEKEKRTYSYSQIDTFQRCHKLWYWQYIEGLSPKDKAKPLQIGAMSTILCDLYTQGILTLEHIGNIPEAMKMAFPNATGEELAENASEVARLLQGYVHYWEKEDIKIISPEVELLLELDDYNVYARLDSLAEDKLGKWRLERKTTSRMDSGFLAGMYSGLQSAISHWLMEELMPEMNIRGTIFDLIVKTKVAQYARRPVPMPPWKVDYAKLCVQGVHEDIEAGRFYPSMDCTKYNKVCEFSILCRNDSPANRQSFFEPRKEAKEREKAMMKKYFETR